MPDISVEVTALNIDVGVTATGPAGPAGDAGAGLPTGGSVGQIPVKLSGSDYDIEWQNPGAASNLETFTAGENINAGRLVVIESGAAWYFQISDPAHAGRAFGISKSSATTGNTVTIQPSGIVTDAGFSSLSQTPVWAIANGQLSNTRPSTGNIQKVGLYIGSNKILIDFTTQIIKL